MEAWFYAQTSDATTRHAFITEHFVCSAWLLVLSCMRRHCAVTGATISVNTSSPARLLCPPWFQDFCANFMVRLILRWYIGLRKIIAIYRQLWSLLINSANKYKLSIEVGTLLLPARCNLLHYHSFFEAAFHIGSCPNFAVSYGQQLLTVFIWRRRLWFCPMS